jgi:Saxitoxin biosynthesis operon protein SxtJ
MALFQLNLKPSTKELRWFAGLWFPLFAAMVAWLLFRRFHASMAALSVAGTVAALACAGLVWPGVIRPVYLGMMRLTFPIGWVVSHVILFVAYFLVITPVGFVVRLFHDPMQRQFDRAARSYWIPREQPERSRYFRQT